MRDARPGRQPLSFRDVIAPVWRRRWFIAIIVVLSTAATYVYFDNQEPTFSASTKVFFQETTLAQLLGESDSGDPDRNLLNQTTLISSRDVATTVARRVGYRGRADDLLKQVSARPSAGSDFILITAEEDTAQGAARLANAFAEAFITIRSANLSREIDRQLETTRRQLARLPRTTANEEDRTDLAASIRQLELAQQLRNVSARQVDPALAPRNPIAPRPKRNTAFALIMSLLLALALAIGLDRFDRRLTRLEDLEAAYDLPTLAVVPHARQPAAFDGEEAIVEHRLREPFRTLRTAVQLSAVDRSLRHIVVTSAVPGEGKSVVVRNLALSYRERGLRVVAVDLDLRRPKLASYLGVHSTPGFTDVLAGEAALEDALVYVRAESTTVGASLPRGRDGGIATLESPEPAGGLHVLPSGASSVNPQALLASERGRDVLERLTADFDVVVIDTAPLLAVSDAASLMQWADGTLLATRVGVSTVDAAARLREQLERVPGMNLLGMVVTGGPGDAASNEYYDYR